MYQYLNYINGRDVAAADGRTFTAFNPTTGGQWGTFALAGAEDVDRAVKAAATAFRSGPWSTLTPTRRGRRLMKWGERIAAHADRIATIETEQNGKLYAEMRAQARIAEDWLYYFGGLADKIEGTVIPIERRSILNYTLREPLGVVGVITPWNSPTFIAIMSLAPALAAGNTIVLKPSEITSGSAMELARLAEESGIPPGVINVVTGFRETGEALVDHPQVAKVSFTGSVAAGRAIAARAGQRLVSCMLELGGKSPNIVFGDANLDQAEAGVLAGIFAAAGQTCVAGSRVYIEQPIYDAFVERLVRRAKKIVIGDPLKAETHMGPVATKVQLEKDESMVKRAVAEGAAILCGGSRPSLAEFPDGYFFEPTIVHQAGKDNFLMRHEVFGPVLAVTPFKDETEALALANDTEFGLAAGVWTRDVRRVHKMARALEAGTVWVNTYRALTFNSPFGGYKASGIGRQNGIEAVYQYLQTKSVWCELGDEIQDPFVMKV
ncbi:MAG: aldehyde dehydrogenase [Acidobacteria bacterium]|nr:aldehyde dehydrogenase [Acidobacteriota bacterium]